MSRATRAASSALGALAALAACKGENAPTVANTTILPDSSEQVMFGLKHYLTQAGVRRAQLYADTAYFYDDGNRIEMRAVRLVFFTASGDSSSVLTGRTGRYDVRQQRVDGRGNVVVTTTDGKRLTSPHLVYDRVINQITSDTTFRFTEPGRQLAGNGLRTDPQLRNVQVLSAFRGRTEVNATALPRPSGPVAAPPAAAPPAAPTTPPNVPDTVPPSAAPPAPGSTPPGVAP